MLTIRSAAKFGLAGSLAFVGVFLCASSPPPRSGPVLTATSIDDVSTQVPVVTAGIMIKQLRDALASLIDRAKAAGLELEVGAGGQIMALLDAIQTAFQDQLDMTLDKVQPRLTAVLNQAKSLLDEAEWKTNSDARELVARTQAIANALPFRHNLPQVISIDPAFVAPIVQRSVIMDIHGNFVDAGRPGYAPTLKLGKMTIAPSAITTTNIRFTLPLGTVPESPTDIQTISGELAVSYRSCSFFFFDCMKLMTFKLPITVLPISPGNLAVTVTVPGTSVESLERTYPQNSEFSQESRDDDIPDPTGEGKQWCVQPDGGWEVEPSTVLPVVTWSEGSPGGCDGFCWVKNSSNAANACWHLITRHHPWGTSGKVHFRIRFTEHRSVSTQQDIPANVDLAWFGSAAFTVPKNATWRAVFTQFDGKRFEFASSGAQSPYMRVVSAGNVLEFHTP